MKISTTSIKKILYILVWLILWQVISSLVNNHYLFAGPIDTIVSLINLLKTSEFYISVINTFFSTVLGFVLAFIIALLLAIGAYNNLAFKNFLEPFFTALKAIPVASLSIVLLIWTSSNVLAIFTSLIIVLPQLYYAFLSGLTNTDKPLLEMANLYHFSNYKKIKYIYRHSIGSYLSSPIQTACSMAFKSTIAAEVIGTVSNSIGIQIYYSKLYLDTANLFAYSLLAILLSKIFELLIVKITNKLGGNYD